MALARVPVRRAARLVHPRNAPRGSRRARRILKLRAFVRLIPSPRGLQAQVSALWRAVRRFGELAERVTCRWTDPPKPRAIIMVATPREPVRPLATVSAAPADTS